MAFFQLPSVLEVEEGEWRELLLNYASFPTLRKTHPLPREGSSRDKAVEVFNYEMSGRLQEGAGRSMPVPPRAQRREQSRVCWGPGESRNLAPGFAKSVSCLEKVPS